MEGIRQIVDETLLVARKLILLGPRHSGSYIIMEYRVAKKARHALKRALAISIPRRLERGREERTKSA